MGISPGESGLSIGEVDDCARKVDLIGSPFSGEVSSMHGMNEPASDASNTDDDEPPRRNWVSFISLLVLQTQNAFNDKAAQFLLVPIGAWLVSVNAGVSGTDKIEYILAAVIVLPFILFSPLAGWFSDRFSKTMVIRGTALLQLAVLAWIAVAIHYQRLWLAVVGFFMLSVQSVMLSPAKRGIVKELVGHRRLGMASGLMEITVVLAICAGQVVTGFWYTDRLKASGDGWDAAMLPLMVLTGASVLALLISISIQKVPRPACRKFTAAMLVEHFGQLGELFKVRELKLSAVGAAFFWGYAGYLNLAAIGIAKINTGGGEEFAKESAILMLSASLGVFFGGMVASLICRRKIELGLVPLGGVVMVVGTVGLAFTGMKSEWLKLWFVVAGGGGALLLVPLNANIQDLCLPEKRGKILAGLNLFDCMAGLAAVLIQLGLVAAGVRFSWQFLGLGVLCVLATHYSAKLLPQHFVRLLGLGLFKIFYRVRPMNEGHVPKEGGVLLTPNHVSYVDAFILSCACPRPVRFLMFDGYFKHPWIGRFVRLFDTVPISQRKAKEGLRVAAEAVKSGEIVCIFPEGQLARTGAMNEFKRGFEMIVRQAGCPVVPVAMDGLWGSVFSFERNKFIRKWPYRIPYGVTVNFGEPIPVDEVEAVLVRRKVEALRADAFAQRQLIASPRIITRRRVKVYAEDGGLMRDYQDVMNEVRGLPGKKQREWVANALQIGEVNAIGRGQTMMLDWGALRGCRKVLGVVFAQHFGLKVVLFDSSNRGNDIVALADRHSVDHFVGGERMGRLWSEHQLTGRCFDFSEGSHLRSNGVFPCLAVEGRVVSMSMPHPDVATATNLHQEGHRAGTWGRLLPGFRVKTTEKGVWLTGASTEEGMLVAGVELDENGILAENVLGEGPGKSGDV